MTVTVSISMAISISGKSVAISVAVAGSPQLCDAGAVGSRVSGAEDVSVAGISVTVALRKTPIARQVTPGTVAFNL